MEVLSFSDGVFIGFIGNLTNPVLGIKKASLFPIL